MTTSPVGFQRFHPKRFFNYQLNRLHSLGFVDGDEIASAASEIRTPADYVAAFDRLSRRAERDGRAAAAAFYERGAELFTPHRSPEKQQRYARFIELFDRAFADEPLKRDLVPYGSGGLPAVTLDAVGHRRGTVVFFGGFDSIVEEFFSIWRQLAEAGFDIIAFDGPGQGGARTVHGLTTEHDWEKPVGAVLEHFGVHDAAIVGMSMGGYWAIRAAAYEPRVRQVVSWPPVYDWLHRLPRVVRGPIQPMLRARRYMNGNVRLRTRLSPVLRQVVDQAMYNAGGDEPIDAVRWFLGMNATHVSSDQVRQHVALVGGEHDSFQPVKLLRRQEAALTSAASVTTRIFTAAEHADQHCQMGNLDLATAWVARWLVEHVDG